VARAGRRRAAARWWPPTTDQATATKFGAQAGRQPELAAARTRRQRTRQVEGRKPSALPGSVVAAVAGEALARCWLRSLPDARGQQHVVTMGLGQWLAPALEGFPDHPRAHGKSRPNGRFPPGRGLTTTHLERIGRWLTPGWSRAASTARAARRTGREPAGRGPRGDQPVGRFAAGAEALDSETGPAPVNGGRLGRGKAWSTVSMRQRTPGAARSRRGGALSPF